MFANNSAREGTVALAKQDQEKTGEFNKTIRSSVLLIYYKTVEEGVVIQHRLLKKVVMTIVLGEGAEFQHAMQSMHECW